MSNQPGSSDFKPSARGEAAWKEAREGIASRNADTRKAGKVERETQEREREVRKQTGLAERQAKVRSNRRTR